MEFCLRHRGSSNEECTDGQGPNYHPFKTIVGVDHSGSRYGGDPETGCDGTVVRDQRYQRQRVELHVGPISQNNQEALTVVVLPIGKGWND